mgnify:CR=1 FL=1
MWRFWREVPRDGRVTVFDRSMPRLEELDVQFAGAVDTVYATQAAIDRAVACVEAGADMVFPEAMTDLAMYSRFAKAVGVPILFAICADFHEDYHTSRDTYDQIDREMSVKAATQALERAGRSVADVDGVIVACSNLQRAYPAVAIEVQAALGVQGFGYDMNVACSSATFGIQAATNCIQLGQAKRLLVVSPEICTGHMNFRDRDSHFIFGDACTAVLLERADLASSAYQWDIVGTRLLTQFSNNIRNNFGFLNRCAEEGVGAPDKLFVQEGRKVFKDVCPMVAELIAAHLADNQLQIADVKRFWLHQANLNMNHLIVRKLLGRDAEAHEAPVILDTYANTSSAGSVIAFHKHQDDLAAGSVGVLSSFGAGYSIGSVILRKR